MEKALQGFSVYAERRYFLAGFDIQTYVFPKRCMKERIGSTRINECYYLKL